MIVPLIILAVVAGVLYLAYQQIRKEDEAVIETAEAADEAVFTAIENTVETDITKL
ncbi:hypothetical protein KGP36_03020 [Patescibacteria group bacterium]|nr:hypothetical protein [Patescibacteria group bacterium]